MTLPEVQQLAEQLLDGDGGSTDAQHAQRVQGLASEIQLAIDTWIDAHPLPPSPPVMPPPICPECGGRGTVLDAPNHVLEGHAYWRTCEECKGTGHL